MLMNILFTLAAIGFLFVIRQGFIAVAEAVRTSGLKKVNLSAEFFDEKPPKQLNQ